MSVVRGMLTGGVLGGLLGIACGILYSVGGFFVDLFTIGLNWGTVLAFGALIGMPVIFAGVGATAGGVIALVWRALRSVGQSRRTGDGG